MPNLLQYLLILEARQVPRMFQIHLPPFPVLKKPCSYKKNEQKEFKEILKRFLKIICIQEVQKKKFWQEVYSQTYPKFECVQKIK